MTCPNCDNLMARVDEAIIDEQRDAARLERCLRDLAQAYEQLTRVQARCTKLVEELRERRRFDDDVAEMRRLIVDAGYGHEPGYGEAWGNAAGLRAIVEALKRRGSYEEWRAARFQFLSGGWKRLAKKLEVQLRVIGDECRVRGTLLNRLQAAMGEGWWTGAIEKAEALRRAEVRGLPRAEGR